MSNHHHYKLKVTRIDLLKHFSLWKSRFETRNIENSIWTRGAQSHLPTFWGNSSCTETESQKPKSKPIQKGFATETETDSKNFCHRNRLIQRNWKLISMKNQKQKKWNRFLTVIFCLFLKIRFARSYDIWNDTYFSRIHYEATYRT